MKSAGITLVNATGINGKQKKEQAVDKIYGITRGIGTTIAHPIRSVKEIASAIREKAKEKGESYVGGYILGEVTQTAAAAGAAAAAGKGLKGAKAAKKRKPRKSNGLVDAGSKGDSDALQIGKTDLDALRNKLSVPETDTIAVGKTDVKGLEGVTFEGQSPKVRSEAGLADLDEIWARRNIKSPGNNPLFTRHAEEVLANDFDRAVIEAEINPQDVSGVLKIHQSNPTGVCRKCIQGLANDNVSPGVLKQLSLKYPNLCIEVTSEILPDVKVTGKSNFVIQNGQYVE